jgi:hypothetical protein
MTAMILRKLRALGLIAAASFAIALSSCQMCDITKNCSGDGDCPGHARVCEKPTVRALASDLDALESHIERYGSVVIQHPAVWGQARLTKHREDFERIMVKDLCNFNLTLQGSLARSDQAYFTNSLALGVAASGPQATITPAVASSSSSAAATPIPTATPDPISPVTLDRNPARLPSAIGFNAISSQGITVEPSVYLNQKARYLNHLNELRRINEGDDTGDSPGYALNLIRVPVSVLPGKHTQAGHGAEVTMTLKPYLSNELLPTTFRNLIMNDLLEVIGVPLTQFLNDKEQVNHFKLMERIYDLEYERHKSWAKVRRLDFSQLQKESQQMFIDSPIIKEMTHANNKQALKPAELKAAMKNFREVFKNSQLIVSATKLRHAKRPFPPSQMLDIFGADETDNIVSRAIKIFKQRDPANKYWVHYPDVQGYLQEELQGAYRFLADPTHTGLWDYCNHELVNAIHTRKVEAINKMRDRFGDQVLATTKRDITEDVTVAFAWAIIVESALLNHQLWQDMKEAAAAKNFPPPTTDWQPYYLPDPPAAARQAFNRYVECRWPIIVFALDPVTEQQNIADSYSSRREMQLAMSLAFVSGQISAKNMTQYARRLEMEMETVALNNTVVGFSHGNETFGWRFYPRYQTPDTESNFTVFFRDQLIGGPNRNALLKQRKLEPGQRECTAIVIMPSFVPYATLETSSTWFKLTNPKCKDMTCVDAVKLSARVKAIENCSPNVVDANCYRNGELERLLNRAKQLEARLPLQSAKVQIPYENTLGGFAMFNTGITDLAPELHGWYGAPGIDTNGSTTLFLVGNHFSVHQTKVIVGGIHVTDTEMLSRQVMRVTIPAGAITLERTTGTFPACGASEAKADCPPPAAPKEDPKKKCSTTTASFASFGTPTSAVGGAAKDPEAPAAKPCCKKSSQELFVDVHVATPYGVTGHLLVPACKVCDSVSRTTTAGDHDLCPCPDETKKKADADRAATIRKDADTAANEALKNALKNKLDADAAAATRVDNMAKDAAKNALEFQKAAMQANVDKAKSDAEKAKAEAEKSKNDLEKAKLDAQNKKKAGATEQPRKGTEIGEGINRNIDRGTSPGRPETSATLALGARFEVPFRLNRPQSERIQEALDRRVFREP